MRWESGLCMGSNLDNSLELYHPKFLRATDVKLKSLKLFGESNRLNIRFYHDCVCAKNDWLIYKNDDDKNELHCQKFFFYHLHVSNSNFMEILLLRLSIPVYNVQMDGLTDQHAQCRILENK